MGALTLKSFPFVLRSWNVKSYDSIDPTDAFGQNTKVYVNKNQIVKIEPQFNDKALNIWLTDKGRQFFDAIFDKSSNEVAQLGDASVKTTKQWESLFFAIRKTFYVFNVCNLKYANRFFFLILFENVSIEVLNFLSLICQMNSFIKVRRIEKISMNANLEQNFQVDSATSLSKLPASSLCVLIGTNSRYEGSYLNLKLRQRYLKGNFKLASLGSLVDLTFPVSFLGSDTLVLKNIAEGNHSFCKDLVAEKNVMFITNSETFKHSSLENLLTSLKVLKYSNMLNKVWYGFNVLNSSLSETGLYAFSRFGFVTFKDLLSFSALYSLNVNLNSVANLHTITKSRLLRRKTSNNSLNESLFINQSFDAFVKNSFQLVSFKNYLYLPKSNFFETQETYINSEGFRKIGSKLIFRKNQKSDWQLLRKFAHNLSISYDVSCVKNNQVIFYNSKSLFDFKNFINFHFQATQNLTTLNDYVVSQNQKFVIYKKFDRFKNVGFKLYNTKLKYWLDDFYIGGKDTFCQNSLTLTRCSANHRLQVTNFF
uniref:NADH dehydrogenase subunit 11 n=1 Tax=Navicula ramosissima TaxID=265559 RepID=A0A343A6U4_9STRA|nr:NADH dehydrogenase subunit 11 [Navicula ramosissima]AOY40382.1 NADH dehydrogenase subunit 11 [Navicula ramosissima]